MTDEEVTSQCNDREDEEMMMCDDGDMIDFSEIILSALTTEEGESIATVLQGLRDAVDKQNKILYKIATLLGAK